MVAERGMSLSGGQKQRISIARTVLKPAEIIIAQRIASICRADKIVVLENGGISACGTHDELMKTCAVYQDIYYSQIGKEDEIA